MLGILCSMLYPVYLSLLSELGVYGIETFSLAIHELSIQGFQYCCTDCLELSVFIYEKFHYHHHTTFKAHLKTELFAAAYDSV